MDRFDEASPRTGALDEHTQSIALTPARAVVPMKEFSRTPDVLARQEEAMHRTRAACLGIMLGVVTVAWLLLLCGCTRHPVEVERPTKGRDLSAHEAAALQDVADTAFRDVRLAGLPPRITLIVKWGADVNPETGETGSAGYPGNIGLTLDSNRDVLTTIRTWVRPCIVHELHHLARKSQIMPHTFRDRLVSEGLATAFERNVAGVDPPWGRPPPEPWVAEVLALPPDADQTTWLTKHPDGRRDVAMRVGTLLVDRASHASGKSPADLVLVPSDEVLLLAGAL